MKSRGFSLIEIAIALAAAAALVWAVVAGLREVKTYIEKRDAAIDKAGYDRAIKETAQRDKQELLAAQDQIQRLQLAREAEAADHARAQDGARRTHNQEMANEKAKTEDLRRRVAAGELVLRDPGRRAGSGCPAGLDAPGGGSGVAPGALAGAAAGGEQAVGQGLSREAQDFLLAEAGRADEVAVDLELCWGIARDDRRKAAAPAR